MSLGVDVVLAEKLGTSSDWMSNVLGQKLFGVPLDTYVSSLDGVSKPIVKLPALPSDVDASGLASFFCTAGAIALRHAYTTFDVTQSSGGSVSVSSPVVQSRERASSGVSMLSIPSDKESYNIKGPAGALLNTMNDMVLARNGMLAGSQIASGCCYEVVLKPIHRQEAVANLGRWPALRSLLELPLDWFADAEDLQRVGVSVRSGALHFQAGWGDGLLSALDVVTVGIKSRSCDIDGMDDLLELRVGGSGSSSGCSGNCRARLFDEIGIRRIATWGKNVDQLKTSPGWFLILDFFGSEALAEQAVTGSDGGVCPCWAEMPAFGSGMKPCNACGFMVKQEGHVDRCTSVRAGGTVRGDTKKKAWVGDAKHALDVREILLNYMPYSEAVSVYADYTSAKGQRRFMLARGLAGDLVDSSAISDAFEADYDSHRDDYRDWLNGELSAGSVAGLSMTGGSVSSGEGSPVSSRAPSVPEAGKGKVQDMLSFVKANDKRGLVTYIASHCSTTEFGLLEQVIEDVGQSLDGLGIEGVCKPTKSGPLETHVFDGLVKGWFDAKKNTASVALAKVVKGRAVSNVSKKNAMRAIFFVCA